ncbi:transcription factor [Ganoderma sinense ZZ0214-1]|uniref:Transcription factor n=1 Tax=Ganoderma sinense ZZ0214-1 TaxID=1077348 RepID=A0A2G8RS23_9APHY|nr:transcription factor [Ganoderma sinense ZZ0214-1]
MSQLPQNAIPGPSNLTDPSRSTLRARFLLKLYEIVNDPANEALVKWSEAGDSFYIFNQERFAREILGKWFKHQNFSSFVRQLNLYGFRKISSLQQGLLRSDNDSETIQFAHPNFHRGQPDLLSLIHRKRNPPAHNAQIDNGALGLLHASDSQDYQGQNPAVDVRSIVEGIHVIRRQQQSIAEDLSALKQSNDALWKEAIEARERHAKHEDTINRILKFLAGLFGRVIEARGGPGGGRPNRLLIGNGGANAGHCQGSDMDTHSEPGSREHSPFSFTSDRFTAVDSPVAPATITEVHDPAPKSPTKPSLAILNELQPQQQTSPPFPLPTVAPSAFNPAPANIPNPNAADPESIWQASLQQMLASPEHFQQVLQTFATPPSSTSPTIPVTAPSAFVPPPNPAQQQQAWSYPYPFAPPIPQTAPPNSLALAPESVIAPTPQEAALLANADRLNKTYQHAGEIDADVNDLQTNLQALIHSMGLDPQNVDFPTVDHPAAPPPTDGLAPWQDGGDPEFFNSFLAQLAETGTGLPDMADASGQPAKDDGEDFSAFLDIPALDGLPPASPGTAALSSPLGTKRKLETAEVPEVQKSEGGPSSKKKR